MFFKQVLLLTDPEQVTDAHFASTSLKGIATRIPKLHGIPEMRNSARSTSLRFHQWTDKKPKNWWKPLFWQRCPSSYWHVSSAGLTLSVEVLP